MIAKTRDVRDYRGKLQQLVERAALFEEELVEEMQRFGGAGKADRQQELDALLESKKALRETWDALAKLEKDGEEIRRSFEDAEAPLLAAPPPSTQLVKWPCTDFDAHERKLTPPTRTQRPSKRSFDIFAEGLHPRPFASQPPKRCKETSTVTPETEMPPWTPAPSTLSTYSPPTWAPIFDATAEPVERLNGWNVPKGKDR